MAAGKGYLMLLYIEDAANPTVYYLVGGMRVNTFTVNNNPVDVTTKSHQGIEQSAPDFGIQQVTIACEGMSSDDSNPKNFNPTDVDNGTNLFTIPNHGFVDNDRVRFKVIDTGPLPSPLTEGTDYYIIDSNVNDFRVTTTRGVGFVDLTTSGGGIMQVYKRTGLRQMQGEAQTRRLSNYQLHFPQGAIFSAGMVADDFSTSGPHDDAETISTTLRCSGGGELT